MKSEADWKIFLRTRLVTLAIAVADVVALAVAFILAVLLRFDFHPAPSLADYLTLHAGSLICAVPVYIGFFAGFRLYRYAWRFASLDMVWNVVLANTLGTLGLWLLTRLFYEPLLNSSVLLVGWLFSISFVGAGRILLRLIHEYRSQRAGGVMGKRPDVRPRRVVILGGGAEAARLIAALQEDERHPYEIIGVLDDSPLEHGTILRGVRVLGPMEALQGLLDATELDEVLIRLPGGNGADIRKYVLACRARQVPVKVIPPLTDFLKARTAPLQLEDFSVEDLLRRAPVCTELSEVGHYLTGKRVLVTGAGGSIGSELCRQILAFQPESLVLFGHGENSLHRIHQELKFKVKGQRSEVKEENAHRGAAPTERRPPHPPSLHLVVGSIADDVRVSQAFAEYAPQVVFHAAAHKHVPLMEDNVPEAVQNNVMGTRCVAEACGRHGVERMVLISTDKAVNPTSVMGATKWLCEEVVRMMAGVYPEVTYVTVRFGNVLGSRGSVTTVFQDQIRRGGPVTVTHPEMTRYFMTIPEAVQLVLQAGAVGRSGQVYLLDMGQPICILDLARDIIRLNGLEPEEDIQITFTGLRPGEKLHEMLSSPDEDIHRASEGLLIVTKPDRLAPGDLREALRHLQQLAGEGSTGRLLDALRDLVPGFLAQGLPEDVVKPSGL